MLYQNKLQSHLQDLIKPNPLHNSPKYENNLTNKLKLVFHAINIIHFINFRCPKLTKTVILKFVSHFLKNR